MTQALDQWNGRVFVWPSLDASLAALIANTLPAATVFFAGEHEGRRAAARDAAVVFGNLPADWLPDCEQLAWLHLSMTGHEPYDAVLPELIERGVTITTSRGLYGTPVAETLLGGLLAIRRKVLDLEAARLERRWIKSEIRRTSSLMSGQRVLVIGRGALGSEIARLLAAFQCEVVAVGRDAARNDVDALLTKSDIVVCAVPHTPDTVGLLDGDRLRLLPRGSLVANVGRGSVLDEEALVDLLLRGQLGGAVLDTTSNEPLAKDDPLWTCPGVVLTQHTGGGWAGEWPAKVDLFLANLRRLALNRPLEDDVSGESRLDPITIGEASAHG